MMFNFFSQTHQPDTSLLPGHTEKEEVAEKLQCFSYYFVLVARNERKILSCVVTVGVLGKTHHSYEVTPSGYFYLSQLCRYNCYSLTYILKILL